MAARKQCEFQLIRYVPDPIRNEFVNIGVLLRAPGDGQTILRFTRNWARVRCLDSDADTDLLEALENEIGDRLRMQPANHPKPILEVLESSLSNGIQLTESKAYLAESFQTGLEELMRLYIDPPKRDRRPSRSSGRAAIKAVMRTSFEAAGVWNSMFKDFAAAPFTFSGDPLLIDCGYRNGFVKLFHAVSVDSGLNEAKLLCLAAGPIREALDTEEMKLQLTAITEPIGWPEGEGLPDAERRDLFKNVGEMLTKYKIVHETTAGLDRIAETARTDINSQSKQ